MKNILFYEIVKKYFGFSNIATNRTHQKGIKSYITMQFFIFFSYFYSFFVHFFTCIINKFYFAMYM